MEGKRRIRKGKNGTTEKVRKKREKREIERKK